MAETSDAKATATGAETGGGVGAESGGRVGTETRGGIGAKRGAETDGGVGAESGRRVGTETRGGIGAKSGHRVGTETRGGVGAESGGVIGVIVVAGGTGSRMGGDVPKQFLPLAGRPVLVHVLERFIEALPDSRIVVAVHPDEMQRWAAMAAEYGLADKHEVCPGGETRYHSVKNALQALGPCDLVAIHDGARPLVSCDLIRRGVLTAAQWGAAVPAVAVSDSLRLSEPEGGSKPLDRSTVKAVQTPQVFRREIVAQAYQTPYDPRFTDDASLVEAAGHPVRLFEGEVRNFKITNPVDLTLAQAVLREVGAGK